MSPSSVLMTSEYMLNEIPLAKMVDEHKPASTNPIVRFIRMIPRVAQWLFGVATLIVILSCLAIVPVLNLISLGYLLEVTGRIVRTGKVRNGFIGVRKAAQIGGVILGTYLVLLPLTIISSLLIDASLIDPASETVAKLQFWYIALICVLIPHILWAWWRGGKLRHFLWPAPVQFLRRVRNGGMYVQAREKVWEFATSLRIPYYFSLGFRGFFATLAWLVIPISLLAVASSLGEGINILTGLLGGLLLTIVLLYLPFLQARFAAENRMREMFAWRTVVKTTRKAPIACWLALLVTLTFSLPLYILKIELLPRDAAWIPAIIFIVFMFTAKIVIGWAYLRANRRESSRHWSVRVLTLLGALPLVVTYTVIVYFTQYLSWHGVWSLYEQHAFLVPAPF